MRVDLLLELFDSRRDVGGSGQLVLAWLSHSAPAVPTGPRDENFLEPLMQAGCGNSAKEAGEDECGRADKVMRRA